MPLTFGPVPSRRFGTSLGIDLSPNSKQCNFDCLYCELKPAKTTTIQTESPQVNDIINEVKIALKKYNNIDVITLTANGEPTLYPYLDDLIDKLNKLKENRKLLILSNGSTVYKNSIFQVLQKIDIVKLSLDCATEECFKKLDRLDKSIDFHKIIDGILTFSKVFTNDLIIEVLFVDGINTQHKHILALYDILKQINPKRIDIGTIDRPPAYKVSGVSFEVLEDISKQFKNLPVNITYKNRPKNIQNFTEEEIIKLLKMRPLTQEDIDNTFDLTSKDILKKLVLDDKISMIFSSGVKFYKIL